MAFRLRPEESIAHGLRRLARGELKAAGEALRTRRPPREDSIHEARRRIKKVRAIVRIIEADHGRGTGGSEKRLRAVSRALSPLRDAEAMLEIFDKLKRAEHDLFGARIFARLRRQLESRKRAIVRAARRETSWKDIARTLDDVRSSVKRWQSRHRRVGVLAAGVRATHRRGHRALVRAKTRQRADDFHEWRKEMKTLWYELRLVERFDAAIRRDSRALHRSEQWLGEDHNLVVLCAELSRDSAICRSAVDVARLKCAAERRQGMLRRKAIASTRRIYAARPRAYGRRIKRAMP